MNPEVHAAVTQAWAARFNRRLTLDRRIAALDAIAAGLDERRAEIQRVCHQETGLTQEELAPEHARMTGTIRLFAGLLREGSWVRATIDTPQGTPIGPCHDIRRMLVPIEGVVAVFGASNFPLAYGVCGGDSVSALAAGCAVVVKEHPAHPRTGRILHEIASSRAKGERNTTPLIYLPHDDPTDLSIAHDLVQHQGVGAIGFTGSFEAGLALQRSAFDANPAKPVFAEMGSANGVEILPGALERRGREIAAELATSILSRNGQQCTKPGLIAMNASSAAEAFIAELAARLDAATPRRMLSDTVLRRYAARCAEMLGSSRVRLATTRREPTSASGGINLANPMLFLIQRSRLSDRRADPLGELDKEIFGPAALALLTSREDGDHWVRHPSTALDDAHAALTRSFYFEPDETPPFRVHPFAVDPLTRAGRLVFNGVPTGVRVCTSMVHGGPFPATNRPDTTAVGPLAIERWCRPVCFQNCPDALLPPELQDANPRGILRTLNGVPTKDRAIRS